MHMATPVNTFNAQQPLTFEPHFQVQKQWNVTLSSIINSTIRCILSAFVEATMHFYYLNVKFISPETKKWTREEILHGFSENMQLKNEKNCFPHFLYSS